jgi:glutamine synthetase adenylyltransferase
MALAEGAMSEEQLANWIREHLVAHGDRAERFKRTLEALDRISQRIRAWQEAHGIVPDEDVAETLQRLREERDEEIQDLR